MTRTIQVLILLTCFLGGVDSQNIGSKGDLETQEEIVGLRNKVDSLNYAYGLSWGDSIKNYYFKNDSTDFPMIVFMDALDSAYVQELNHVEIYKKGIKVGYFIKKQNFKTLMGDSTIAYNQKLVEVGLIDVLNGSYYLMKPVEAKLFIQRKMNKPTCGYVADRDEITIRILNYAYGMTIGSSIKDDYIKGDSANSKIKSFIAGLVVGTKEVEYKYIKLVELGTDFGISLKEQVRLGFINDSTLKLNTELIKQGLIRGLLGYGIGVAQDEREYLRTTLQTHNSKNIEKINIGNKAAGEKFLAENAKKPGIITTASGLQYEVLIKGNGEFPKDSGKVKVNYRGTLIDGTLFDNSKEPIIFPVNQVLKGWTEAFKLMPVGSKFKIYLPQELAYGNKQQGLIKPFSMLIFEMELLSIEE